MSLAALLLFLPTHAAKAQTTDWILTRCNPDGTAYRNPHYYNFAPSTLHGPLTVNGQTPYLPGCDWLNDGIVDQSWDLGRPTMEVYNERVVTADVTGNLLGYFKWVSPASLLGPPMGMGLPPPPPPPVDAPPTYMDLLLTTGIGADSWVSSDSLVFPWQTSTVVTASDSLGETYVYPGPGVVGHHLLHLGLDSNGVAKVKVDAKVHVSLSNAVPLPNNAEMCVTYGVRASVGVDNSNREVTISANVDTTNKKVPAVNTSGAQTTDANGDANFTSAPNTRTADGTMYGIPITTT